MSQEEALIPVGIINKPKQTQIVKKSSDDFICSEVTRVDDIEYNPREVAEKLKTQTPVQYLETRPGPGGQELTYISTEGAIKLANEVFGYNKWCSEVRKVEQVFIENSNGTWTACYSAVMRVTLIDGAYHEDEGTDSKSDRDKGKAIENARKGAISDSLKRALRHFGDMTGNSIYNKKYADKMKGEVKKRKQEELQQEKNKKFNQQVQK